MFENTRKSFFKDVSNFQSKVRRRLYKKGIKRKVAVLAGGGLGDFLIACNHLWYFKKRFLTDLDSITFVFLERLGLAQSLVSSELADDVVSKDQFIKSQHTFDLIVNFNSVTDFIYIDRNRYSQDTELLKYVSLCNSYRKNARMACTYLYTTMKLCELEGKKFFQRADIANFLGVEEKYRYPLPYPFSDEKLYLSNNNLSPKKFITIQTGCDNKYRKHVKLWPTEHYLRLIEKIKKSYPSYEIVQVGNAGVDLETCGAKEIKNLLNKTTIDEVKILLKNSLLHIDVEGGLVHLRHALEGGQSIVLFGPTSEICYGYGENINIRGTACLTPCYRLTSDWPSRCPKTHADALCMKSISPDIVFEYVEKILKKCPS